MSFCRLPGPPHRSAIAAVVVWAAALLGCGSAAQPGGKADVGGAADASDSAGPGAVACTVDKDCASALTACQVASCVGGKCSAVARPAGAVCSDGDECSVGDACSASAVCLPGAQSPDCDDKNACTADSCVPSAGCVHAAKSSGACDDGDPCTQGDHCSLGVCKSGSSDLCACRVDGDCAALANLCTGPMVCDKDMFPYTCKAVGAGVVCTDPNPDDCMAVTCNPAAVDVGKACVETAVADASPCSDGVACTVGDACSGGECKYATSLCECLADQDCAAKFGTAGKLCSGQYVCSAEHACQLLPATVCPPANLGACLTVACNEATGKCEPVPVKKSPLPCDDGNACTSGDACEVLAGSVYTGKCVAGANTCKCSSSADCAGKEDGDVCNGTLFCNQQSGECELNPATVVVCPTASDTACQLTLCNKQTGLCESVPTERLVPNCPAGEADCGAYVKLPAEASALVKPCDDGNVCTAASECKAGQCVAEPSALLCSCGEDADCAGLGDKCSGTFYCNLLTGKCQLNPATVVVCSASGDSQCAKNVCNPQTGLCSPKPVASGAAYVPCEDGNACTKLDYCSAAGQCVSGPNTCKCEVDADCAGEEDGNACNGKLICNKAAGACVLNPATVVACSPQFDTACRKNVCQWQTGECALVPRSDDAACDDGSACTVGDVCAKGVCVSGKNSCECQDQGDCAAKEDSDLCNGTLYCDLAAVPHKCKVSPATTVTCPTGKNTACLLSLCDPSTGVCALAPHPQLGVVCDDGNPCTSGDFCAAGVCAAGPNLCGCALDADCAGVDDANPCNGKLYCDTLAAPFACKTLPGSAKVCSGGGECSQSVCSPTTGACQTVPVSGACDDGNPCTADACAGACSHEPVANGLPCSPGLPAKLCTQGVCK